MKRALGLVAIPATFLGGAVVARAYLRGAPPSLAIDRAQPLLVVTAWAAYGERALALLVATLLLATLALAWTLRHVDGKGALDARDVRALLAVALAATLACTAWPFAFSSDIYAYAAYGDLALRGLSPYVAAPANVHDALLDGARWQWSGAFPPCVYGPLFVGFAATVVAAAHALALDAAGTLGAFRFAAIAAYLATIAGATVAFPGRIRPIAIAALNPVVVWSVAEGHNDVYALLAVVAVAAFARRGGKDARAFAIGVPVALALKASAALPLLALALDALLVRRRSAAPIVRALAGGLLLAVALDVPLLAGALARVARHGRYAPAVSLPGAIGLVPALVVAAACGAVALVVLARRRPAGFAWLGLAAFAALPSPYPWYGVLLAPLAVAAGQTPASAALYAVTIIAALRYLPDAFGEISPGVALATSLVAVAPMTIAVFALRHDLRPEKDSPPT